MNILHYILLGLSLTHCHLCDAIILTDGTNKTLMVGHGGSSAGSYLADPTSPIPSHCASIVVTNTLRVNED